MEHIQKNWRSKRIKSTLPDRIGKDAARLWYTINLGLQEAELRHLRKEQETLWFRRPVQEIRSLEVRKQNDLWYWENYWPLQHRITLRHCKIERLKRFLNNLQK